MSHPKISRLDRAGIFVSVACAIHCALLPVLLSLLPLAGLAFLQNRWIELLIISSSVLIAATSLFRSYFHHKRIGALLVVAAGFMLLYLGHQPAIGLSWLWLSAGGLFIAIAHLLNWRFHYTCEHQH